MTNVSPRGDFFRGRTALVTGAGRGIGRALSEELASRGCAVFMLDVDRSLLDTSAGSLRASGLAVEPIACDLSDVDQVGEAVARVRDAGTIDILVNNASIVPPVAPLQALSRSAVDLAISVNLAAPIELCRLLLPDLMRRPSAWIVNVCSQSAHYMPLAFFGTYIATKAALASFSECLRQELAESSVSVLRVEPGPVRTEGYLATDMSLLPRAGGSAKPVEPPAIASAIVEAMIRRRATLYHPPVNRPLKVLNAVAPGLVRRSVAKDQLARARHNS